MRETSLETELLPQIRQGSESAWREMIEIFEGRLRAFAFSRLGDRLLAEDVVQETFVGFLTSLPHYDEHRTPLESFLFRITAYKITDHLRKQGRRPNLSPVEDPVSRVGNARKASSLARSREQGTQERNHLLGVLKTEIQRWQAEGQWERLKTCELLFVRGWSNKQVAEELQITQQQVANHKQAFLNLLKKSPLNAFTEK